MNSTRRDPGAPASPRPRRWPWLLVAAVVLASAVAALAAWCSVRAGLYPVAELARRAPRRTALMAQRAQEAAEHGRVAPVDRRWVPYDHVSPLLRRAILVAEDDGFFAHGGLDWNEIRASARRNLERRRIVRGGSTITQQLAKNLFLGDARTLTRKLTEAFLAVRLERTLSKRRIFELYLNEIEWGDGIYGAEAAARRYFGVAAADLNPRQALLLAAVIINPRRYSVLAPPRRIERRVKLIAGRLRRRGFLDDGQYAEAVGQPRPWFFGLFGGPPAPADTTLAPIPDSAGDLPVDSAGDLPVDSVADTAMIPAP